MKPAEDVSESGQRKKQTETLKQSLWKRATKTQKNRGGRVENSQHGQMGVYESREGVKPRQMSLLGYTIN